ncbi:MAG: hypothetical protein JXR25_13525 [Pontiellaceae bacterium]|nr:hypothetical protein [Pontiellaceae bacterium]MBN2785836.1 hypothetical protein [Pontiellaceae bacterium]
MKQRSGKGRGISKGAPSGLVISLAFHGAVFFIAGLFVVFTVVNKSEPEFEAPPTMERPKMALKKPKVKVNKSSKPKPSSRIVAKVQTKNMPEIQLPDMDGFGDGLMGGVGIGGDFMEVPDFTRTSLFGREDSVGTDFEGHLYQLTHNRNGGAASNDENSFRAVVRDYVLSGWDDTMLSRYYCFPKKLYTSHFVVPPIPSPMAPYSFGARDMECYYMFAVYKGKLVFHEDIKFRFWGMGDAFLFVNVDGKEVLVNGWDNHCEEYFNWWKSHAPDDYRYMWCNLLMSVGDWIELKAGEPVDMKVLYGEWKGGSMGAGLLVEVEGVDYPSSHWNGPLLPVFKTEGLSWDDMTEICKHLPIEECSLTNGPVFNDFGGATAGFLNDAYTRKRAEQAAKPEEAVESAVREWTLANGKVVEAEFKGMIFDEVVLKTAAKEIRIAPDQLSDADRRYIRLCNPPDLKIEFSRKTSQINFPPELFADNLPPEGVTYQFTTKIKQISSTSVSYGFPLTAEIYAIGEQIMSDKHVLLDHQVKSFILSNQNAFSFECVGKKVDLFDYELNRVRRGTRYGGYLVVIRDEQGNVVAHKESSKHFYENLNNIALLQEGWYFDDKCRRCLPDQPPPWDRREKNDS